MKHFTLTKEMIQNANSYLPLVKKAAIAAAIAEFAMAPEKSTENSFGVPPMMLEDRVQKNLHFMTVFLREYLHIQVPEEFSAMDYDYYAGGHIFNQLERMKSDPTLKNKVIDIQTDLRDLRHLIDMEMHDAKYRRNNCLDRILGALTVFSSPDNLVKIREELDTVVNMIDKRVEDLHGEEGAA